LLVDEQRLADLICSEHTAIPYWLFEGDLPHFSRYLAEDDPTIKVIGVCSCGEGGCGCVECHVIRANDIVMFRDFQPDLRWKEAQKDFMFTASNYDSVITEIMEKVAEHQTSA
jgi:hypothetical protein